MSDEVARRRVQHSIRRIILYAVAVFFALVYLLPLYVMVNASVTSFETVSVNTMWQLPKALSLKGFMAAWVGDPLQGFTGLGRYFVNSLIITIPAMIVSVFLGAINGYILTKWKFKGSNLVFLLILFGMFIPLQSILIPLVEVVRMTGLYGTRIGLALACTVYGIPITTLLFRSFYGTLPTSLVECARIDGAGFFKIFFRIAFPLSLSAITVASIWQFTQIWNGYLLAVVLTQRPEVQPITVGLLNMVGAFFVRWNIIMAGAFIAAIPTLFIYVLVSRYFVKGIMSGAVKG
ncbi:MAG: carbohydrate ABC transporter permease [Syntrophobacterales bacterium]|nr:MAG: carbohydrate ABC transporter permease [Syntrophobacterales bacterium]